MEIPRAAHLPELLVPGPQLGDGGNKPDDMVPDTGDSAYAAKTWTLAGHRLRHYLGNRLGSIDNES